MFYRVTNQFKYFAAYPDVITDLGEGIHAVETHFMNDQTGERLMEVTPQSGDAFYIISTQITADIEFETDIPQFEAGVFTLSARPPAKNTFSIYEKGADWLIVEEDQITYYRNNLVGDGQWVNSPRYGRDGVLLSYYANRTMNYNTPVTLTQYNSTNHVKFLLEEGENKSTVESDALSAFLAKEYFYNCKVSGTVSGWCRKVADGLHGEYTAFGDANGTKTIGFLQFTDPETKTYVLDFDIIEENDVYSVTYQENNEVYTRTGRPTASGVATFNAINEEADPQEITLTFDSYVSHGKAHDFTTTGVFTV